VSEPADLRYVIVGSGRQGTAAAYDLARFGQAARIVLDRGIAHIVAWQ
jgi:thioredoxin reductase